MKISLPWHNIFYHRNEVEVFRWVAKAECAEFELQKYISFAIGRQKMFRNNCVKTL